MTYIKLITADWSVKYIFPNSIDQGFYGYLGLIAQFPLITVSLGSQSAFSFGV